MSEVVARDMLIDALVEASDDDAKLEVSVSSHIAPPAGIQQQLTTQRHSQDLVKEALLSLDKDFWLRFAVRTESAQGVGERDAFASLATKVMRITDRIVKASENSMDDASTMLVSILEQGANEAGEWHVPLAPDACDRMRMAMRARLAQGGEGGGEALLSTAYAWIRKASGDDGGEGQGMVPLLQKVLQLYASEFLLANAIPAASEAPSGAIPPATQELARLLAADESEWAAMTSERRVAEADFLVEVQKLKEMVALGMRGGGHEQRVLIEFLQELEERAKEAYGAAS